MIRYFFIIIVTISLSFTQWFTINHEGMNRTYYVSYPDNATESTPLIINMHGYGGTAQDQQAYSQMDQFAHAQNMAVVYPQGLNYSWNVFTYWDSNSYDDVGFISMMIDDIVQNFDIDLNKVYACGMSNGGYMSYRLACDLSDKITAFGSVTGNFMINAGSVNDCQDQNRDIPIIHLHGTSDGVVNYYPPSFDYALTAGESIEFWSEYNNLTDESIESINPNVEVYTYYNQSNSTKFVHYKVYGGGHEWFGSPWAVNWGFNTSEVLVDFFLQYELSDFINSQLDGDINEDSSVNIQDVILTINLVINNEYNALADLNSDEVIDILDIVQLVNIILYN